MSQKIGFVGLGIMGTPMALNLIKLCVGCDSVKELEGWIRQRVKDKKKRGR